FDRPVAPDLIVRVATSLGRLRHWEGEGWIRDGDDRHDALTGVLNKSAEAGSQQGARPGWPADERSKLWPLLRLGYGEYLRTWIAANSTAEDLPTIAENGVACGDPFTLREVMNFLTVGQPPEFKSKV